FHEGDWEHVTVLLDPGTRRPAYLWMARHADEGVALPWNDVKLDDGHPVIYPSFGGHATYPETCKAHARRKIFYVSADFVVCAPGVFSFGYAATPLVDLAHVPWACWRGHFGKAGPSL